MGPIMEKAVNKSICTGTLITAHKAAFGMAY
jgi:hypothetical protein